MVNVILQFTCMILLFAGCSRQNTTSEMPYSQKLETITNNDVVTVRQGLVMEDELTKAMPGVAQTMRAATLHIENKNDSSLVVEIDQSNLWTYDAEDLAYMCSEEESRNKNRYRFLYSTAGIEKTFIQLATGIFSASWVGFAANSQHGQHQSNLYSLSFMWLPALAIIGVGSYLTKIINNREADSIESQKELSFKQFRQTFEKVTLAFDSTIEIKPHETVKKIIFFDTTITPDNPGQQKIVLQLKANNEQTLLPLAL